MGPAPATRSCWAVYALWSRRQGCWLPSSRRAVRCKSIHQWPCDTSDNRRQALNEVYDSDLGSKDHDVTLILLSGSIRGTLFATQEVDQIDANRYKPFHLAFPRTRKPLSLLTPARSSSMSLLSEVQSL